MDEEDIEWKKSKAKKLLFVDLSDGTIPLDAKDMPPQTVYLQRPEFSEIQYERFRTNLNDMRKNIRAKKTHAASDSVALAHDRAIHPKKPLNHRGEPRWEGSEAERLLKVDIDNGMNEGQTPSELWKSREEYQYYPLTVFRKHVHQEVKLRKFIAHRRAKKQK